MTNRQLVHEDCPHVLDPAEHARLLSIADMDTADVLFMIMEWVTTWEPAEHEWLAPFDLPDFVAGHNWTDRKKMLWIASHVAWVWSLYQQSSRLSAVCGTLDAAVTFARGGKGALRQPGWYPGDNQRFGLVVVDGEAGLKAGD